jgi:hypothetical protein
VVQRAVREVQDVVTRLCAEHTLHVRVVQWNAFEPVVAATVVGRYDRCQANVVQHTVVGTLPEPVGRHQDLEKRHAVAFHAVYGRGYDIPLEIAGTHDAALQGQVDIFGTVVATVVLPSEDRIILVWQPAGLLLSQILQVDVVQLLAFRQPLTVVAQQQVLVHTFLAETLLVGHHAHIVVHHIGHMDGVLAGIDDIQRNVAIRCVVRHDADADVARASGAVEVGGAQCAVGVT